MPNGAARRADKNGCVMLSWKRISHSRLLQKTLGWLVSGYLRLVWKTSSLVLEPADIYDRVDPDLPIIVAMWHGQHFMTPFVKRDAYKAKVLISRHRDGEINAIAAERLGLGTVRGSGNHGGRFDLKGGVSAFKEMLDTLQDGYNMALTADVPKVARVAGKGIVTLSRFSGRPVYPVAVATSRRIELKNWDRSTINLPFSRLAIVIGEPVTVPADADDAQIENARRAVEEGLNAATRRAYNIVDHSRGSSDRA
jgi:hypothetical protein